mgnify:CR=1 FL=1
MNRQGRLILLLWLAWLAAPLCAQTPLPVYVLAEDGPFRDSFIQALDTATMPPITRVADPQQAELLIAVGDQAFRRAQKLDKPLLGVYVSRSAVALAQRKRCQCQGIWAGVALNDQLAMLETMICFQRAGASGILTYAALEIAKAHDHIRCTAGIHPHDAGKATEEWITTIREELAEHEQVVGDRGLADDDGRSRGDLFELIAGDAVFVTRAPELLSSKREGDHDPIRCRDEDARPIRGRARPDFTWQACASPDLTARAIDKQQLAGQRPHDGQVLLFEHQPPGWLPISGVERPDALCSARDDEPAV